MTSKEYIDYLVNWLKKEVKTRKAKGLVVGVSGGIDSAVASCLIKQAFPNNHLVLWMDIQSSKNAYENAMLHIKQFNLHTIHLNLNEPFLQLNKQFDLVEDLKSCDKNCHLLSHRNIKPRLRMISLYQFAQLHKYLVVGTSNLDEIYLGYYTKWGDGAADLYPLANLTKNKVYKLAKALKVNQKIIDEEPSADLFEGQTDEKEMNITYKTIDNFLEGKKINKKDQETIEQLHQKSKHKRNVNLPKPKLSF